MRITLALFFSLFLTSMADTPSSNLSSNTSTGIFAGGCFWCIQPFFDQTPGVIKATVGYTGGKRPNPTYEQVSTGVSGHREALQITYDPSKVTYEQLLEVFWTTIDPHDPGGQFYDRGEQYTTAIYYVSDAQKAAAEASKAAKEKMLGKPIATLILPVAPFYAAEDYHQSYYKKAPQRYESYKKGSGREPKLEKIWGKDGAKSH